MEKEAKHEDFYIREDGVKVYMLPGEEEKIEVPVDELPPVADIDNALKVLIAPLRFWLYLASEYHKKGDYESADHLLKEVTTGEAIGHYRLEFPAQECDKYYSAIFAGRAGLYAARASKAATAAEADKLVTEGTKILDDGSSFFNSYSTTFFLRNLSQGFLDFAGGYRTEIEEDSRRRIQGAVQHFVLADESARGSSGRGFVLANLANACANMALENWKEAWALLRQALKTNPHLPSWANTAFAVVLLHLGQKEAAKASLKDALDANNEDSLALALMGTLIWEEMPHTPISDPTATPLEVRNSLLENEKKKAIIREHARSYLVKALEHDSSNILAKLRLAEVQFGRWTPITVEGSGEAVHGTVLGTGMLIETTHDISLRVRPGEVLRLGGVWKVKLAVDPEHEPKNCQKTLKLAEPLLQVLENQPMFYRDYESSRSLAASIIKEPNVDKVTLVEAHYLDARAKQAGGDYYNARLAYRAALKLAKAIRLQFPAAIYGLAQCHLYAQELEKAKTRFQELLSLPGLQHHRESLRAIAHILMLQDSMRVDYIAEAIKNLKQVTEMNPNDSEAWLELAEVLQRSVKRQDLLDARNAYRKAISMQPLRPPSPELWNNYGAILHRLGEAKEAEEVYLKAIKTVCRRTYENVTIEEATTAERIAKTTYSIDCITTAYNLARVRERLGKTELAESMYKSIIDAQPHYVDAYLCLGVMKRNAGKFDEAEKWFMEADKNVVSSKISSAEALTFRGLLYESIGERAKARGVFEKIASSFRIHNVGDPYAMIWLGNYNIMRGVNATGISDKHIDGAVACYKTVLEIQPTNLYAANGLGMALLGQNRVTDAKLVFSKVREMSVTEIPPVCLNLAFCHMALGEHVQSVQLYDYVSTKIYNNQNVDVLLQLARAYAVAGRVEEAIKPLRAAIRVDPSDLLLWYNLATVLKSSAVDIAEKTELHSLANAKKAMKMVESSIRIFTWLSAEGERSEAEAAEAKQAEKKAPPSLPFKLQRVRENVEALTADRAVFLRFVRQQEEEESRKEQERREAQRHILVVRERLQEEKRRAEEEEKERADAEQAQAEELQQRLKLKKQEWMEQEAAAAAAAAGSKRVRVVEEDKEDQEERQSLVFRSSIPSEIELLALPGGAGSLVRIDTEEALHLLFGQLPEEEAEEWDLGVAEDEGPTEKPSEVTQAHEEALESLFGMDDDEEEEMIVEDKDEDEDEASGGATKENLFGDNEEEEEGTADMTEDREDSAAKRQKIA